MDFIAIGCTIYILFICFFVSKRYWKLRNKSYEELTLEQKKFVCIALQKDGFRRNRYTPEKYLKYLQKAAVYLPIIGILVIIFWIGLIYYIVNYF